jgi:hypothetical protein
VSMRELRNDARFFRGPPPNLGPHPEANPPDVADGYRRVTTRVGTQARFPERRRRMAEPTLRVEFNGEAAHE